MTASCCYIAKNYVCDHKYIFVSKRDVQVFKINVFTYSDIYIELHYMFYAYVEHQTLIGTKFI